MSDKGKGYPRQINDGYEVLPLDAVKPHPRNPRRGDLDAIKASVDVNGFYGAVVANKRTGYILAGNHRWMAAKALELPEIPVVWVDVGDAEEKRILAADNRTAELGGYDDAVLASLLQGLQDDGGLLGTGYEDDDLAKLISDLSPALFDEEERDYQAEGDKALEAVKDEWGVERGQVWSIGEHRLMCGDSTSKEDVARLLNGASPGLMVTDPPYGVNYDPNWRNDALGGTDNDNTGRAVGIVSNDHNADWTAAYKLFPGDVAYVWHPIASKLQSVFLASLESVGFEVKTTITWAKSQFVVGRSHYHVQHEPCFYAVRKGSSASWAGSRKQSTLWAIDKPRSNETGHSTQKPLECMARPIRNHTHAEVYEPFNGSGTTMVAAQELGRKCYAMELDPRYVAVALQRLSDMGLTPELIEEA